MSRGVSIYISISIYFACLSVCICLFPTNVEKAEPIGLKFCVEPPMTEERLRDAQNYKNVCPKVFDFENARTNIIRELFCLLLFILYTIKSLNIIWARSNIKA